MSDKFIPVQVYTSGRNPTLSVFNKYERKGMTLNVRCPRVIVKDLP